MPSKQGERFDRIRKLGEGGMGVVFEAFDRQRNQHVALKTLQNMNPWGQGQFKSEFRALANVVHPNLVTLYELFIDENEMFFTMELVAGVDFLSWVRPGEDAAIAEMSTQTSVIDRLTGTTKAPAHDPDSTRANSKSSPMGAGRKRPAKHPGLLRLDRLRAAGLQLAEGVAAIHANGMLHRDLKPSNVLVSPEGRVVVLDFGLITDQLPEFGQREELLVGTPAYMSPEQADGAELTCASDWYSYGTMLYESLTGYRPFSGRKRDILVDKRIEAPKRVGLLAPAVPAELAELADALLEIPPLARPEFTAIVSVLADSDESGSCPDTPSLQLAQQTRSAFIGRQGQLAELERAVGLADASGAMMVNISGESGQGKTALISAFCETLQGALGRDDLILLHGRCHEQESVPFKAIDGVVDALARYLALLPDEEAREYVPQNLSALGRIFPVIRQSASFQAAFSEQIEIPDPREIRRQAFAALKELLFLLSRKHTILVDIDDLQWGDSDSASLLAAILSGSNTPRLLVIASSRAEYRSSSPFYQAFDSLARDAGISVRELYLDPLPEADAMALASIHLETEADNSRCLRIAQESGGNPFFIEELARYERSADKGERAPVSLRDALIARLDLLSDDENRLLAAVAVAGGPLGMTVAMQASQVDDPRTVEKLKANSFLQPLRSADDRRLECYHDRIREAATSMLSQEALRDCHYQIAIAIENSENADAEQLMAHFFDGGDTEAAARYALIAAERAEAALAFGRAADLYGLALSLNPEPGMSTEMARAKDRQALRLQLANALVNAGRAHEAAKVYLDAADQASAADKLVLRQKASLQFLRSGHVNDGKRTLDVTLVSVGMASPRGNAGAIAWLLTSRVKIALGKLRWRAVPESEIDPLRLQRLDTMFVAAEGLGMLDTIHGAAFQGRYLVEALKVGEERRIGYGLLGEAGYVSLAGPKTAKRVARMFQMVDKIEQETGDPVLRGLNKMMPGIVAFQEGRLVDALSTLEAAEVVFREECMGASWELLMTQVFRAFTLVVRGRLAETRAWLPAIIAEAADRGDLFAVTTLRVSVGFCKWLLVGDTEAGIADVDEAMGSWPFKGFHLQHCHELLAKSALDVFGSNARRAVSRFRERWGPLKRSHLLQAQVLRAQVYTYRGRAELLLGLEENSKENLRVARRFARKLKSEKTPYCVAFGSLLQAGLEKRKGNEDEALRLLVDAESWFREAGLDSNAVASGWARGRMVGGDEGQELIELGVDHMRKEGHRDPEEVLRRIAIGL